MEGEAKEIKEEKILVKGIITNFKISGEGKPLLILHGWGSSSDSWLEVQKELSEKKHRIICPDFPGFGKSGNPSVAWDVSDYEKWLLEFVDSLKLDKFFLVAHSFGGRIAAKFIVHHSKKIKKAVLCAPAGLKIKPDFKTKMILAASALGSLILSIEPLKVLKEGIRNFFYFFLRRRDYVKANGLMRQTMKKILAEDLTPYFSKINKKTLLVWGKRDRMIPVRYASVLKKKIKKSELEILPKAGHSPNLEDPKKLAEIINGFLKSR